MASVSSASSLNGSIFGRSLHLSYSIYSYLSHRDGFQDDLTYERYPSDASTSIPLELRSLNAYRRNSVDSRKNTPFLIHRSSLTTSKETHRTSSNINRKEYEQRQGIAADSMVSLHALGPGHDHIVNESLTVDSEPMSTSVTHGEGSSRAVVPTECPSSPALTQETPLRGVTAGRIRVTKDHWRKEKRLPELGDPATEFENRDTVGDEEPHAVLSEQILAPGPIHLQTTLSDDIPSHQVPNGESSKSPSCSISTAAATEQALRLVRLAELDRQRVLHYSKSPPKDEYSIIEEDIPPYRAQLHRYLDLISYDERFTPILRVNRYLVNNDSDLTTAINKFSKFNLLPLQTNLWAISHVDDNEYENMIPALIPESSYYTNEFTA